jgi:predicted secreted hydrolase
MQRSFLLFIVLAIVPVAALAAQPATQSVTQSDGVGDGTAAYARAIGPRQWSFPRDHGRHGNFRLEWWYFTGNLADGQAHRWGYELTIFRTIVPTHKPAATQQVAGDPPGAATRVAEGPSTRPVMREFYFAHAAITDAEGKRFVCRQKLAAAQAGVAEASDQMMDAHIGDWSIKMIGQAIALRARSGYSDDLTGIDLSCEPKRPPTLQGAGGLSQKSGEVGAASYYYSFTRLATTGTLTLASVPTRVSGLSWMDHEFSSGALGPHQIGWDWMCLQMDDGRDVMIYRLRDSRGEDRDVVFGTVVGGAGGEPEYLDKTKIRLTESEWWTSPVTGARYPLHWRIDFLGGQMGAAGPIDVRPILADQEMLTLLSSGANYYEGASEARDASGKVIGRGYLEMTGYERPLPASW